MTRTLKPLVPTGDRDSKPWWEALSRHELTVQRCDHCAHLRWPARAMCNQCGGFEWTWVPTSGRGSVVSWIVNRHHFSPAFPSPYVVVAVRLDEQDDLVLPGSWDGSPEGDGLRIGLPVTVGFEDVEEATGATGAFLHWSPA
jgi:uncharacterized OB-fold protein